MVINIEKINDAAAIKLTGRLDTTTAPILEGNINEQLETNANIIIDMAGLEYISSAGLRVLLGAQKKVNGTGSMKLVNVTEAVMDVLEMTGFADILVIE
jgi:anti-sigma B factor antagonist